MLFGAHLKKSLVSWFIKMCGSFPWDMCIIFTEEFHFSLPPILCIACTRLLFISCDFQNFFPFSLKPPPFNYPKGKRLCEEEEGHFLKWLILLRVRGMVNLRNGLSVSPDDSMQLWNKLETVCMRRKGWGDGTTCVYVSPFFRVFFFFLSVSFFFFLIFALSRLDFRLAVQKRGHVVPASPFKLKFTEWRTM